MKKTSLYLDEEHQHLLKLMAERERRSQADVIRDAISLYAHQKPDRHFAVSRVGLDGTQRVPWDGRSIADIPEEELMAGFGAP